MKKRWIAELFLSALTGSMLLTGCGEPEEVPAVSGEAESEMEETLSGEIDTSIPIEKGARIAVVVKSTSGEFWENIKQGMEDAVASLNEAYDLTGSDKITMTFEGPDSAEDLTDMINTADAVLSENPTVLCLASGDEDAGVAQLESARENGIPVILFDSLIKVEEEDLFAVYCGSDDRGIGAEAAKRLAEAMGGAGEAAVVSHGENDQTSLDRIAGFQEELRKTAPEIKLRAELVLTEEEDPAEQITGLLEAYPELGGIFCTNVDTAEAVLDVLEEQEQDGPKLVGVDGSSRQIEAIRDGKEVGVVSQDPYEMGFQTICMAAQIARDPDAVEEKTVYVDHAWLDAENLDLEENARYLY